MAVYSMVSNNNENWVILPKASVFYALMVLKILHNIIIINGNWDTLIK